ncbi:carboxylesterase family protein [Filimonas effusa]|uniref:Peptidase S9 prolyl oligopeptidase catalytic domain-containing protein n=1 Tax=Filimonas effusa TaxID=2508721 RepID=A0A4Q1D7W2_9BACT|nr:prolyl oligopeptidase family serine peptidase [Filimonas effusa]RXK85331.1 hypothetical protein ESB13_00450 [Filimonas effusa]
MRMRQLLVVFIFLPILATAQLDIPYIAASPIIDGILEPAMQSCPLQQLQPAHAGNNLSGSLNVSYCMAYHRDFFYLYIETPADSIINRDRPFQNGDGFQLVIAKPEKENQPASEFYVLGFGPEGSVWSKIQWYYNVDLAFRRLSPSTQLATKKQHGRISFELLLPWKEVYPYHPWLNAIGINLYFVKASGTEAKRHYSIKEDELVEAEGAARKYEVANFVSPSEYKGAPISQLKRNNIEENEALGIVFREPETAFVKSRNIMVNFRSGEDKLVKRQSLLLAAGDSHKTELTINTSGLIAGGYTIEITEGNDIIAAHNLSILPHTDIEELKHALTSLRAKITQGSYYTLLFYIEDLAAALKKMKTYETSYELRQKIADISRYLSEAQKGNDQLICKTGVFRRAYYSQTNQQPLPYSIKIPANYNPNKKYPLLIYLHGSGDDDRVLGSTSSLPDDFIVLAPNGRGVSNCYATAGSQQDIAMSIADALDNYNIDGHNIILSGFSMGGYGVYRTFYEHPGTYKAIAIISGHPNLARDWGNEKGLNFLDKRNLAPFHNSNVFVFHGKQDMNCPYAQTERLVTGLRQAGARVTFVTDDAGHGNMAAPIQQQYFEWLRKQIAE